MNHLRGIKRLKYFAKAQCSAFAGVLVDYSIMILLTDFAGVHFATSIAIGGIVGAAVNFSINKIWAFRTKGLCYKFNFFEQLWRFICVALGGILLKIIGTYFLTSVVLFYAEGMKIGNYIITEKLVYKYCRPITDAIVCCFFNYKLQRHWVFKSDNS
jgi:putative flippase GtrA